MTHSTIADVSQVYQAPSHSRGAAATSFGRSIGARWPRPSITTNRVFGSESTFPEEAVFPS